jgi:hypothetical protein
MRRIAERLPGVTTVNGGHYDSLDALVQQAAQDRVDALWWMPDVPNDLPKLVGAIKDRVPRSVLVISKNNSQGKYAHVDLVARMLRARANLALTIDTDAPFEASIIDPLGNAFCKNEASVLTVADTLMRRTQMLAGFTRMGSQRVGDAIPAPNTPEVQAFVDIVRGYASTFHDMVHGANPSRFLGNASFRCTRGGFPAFRDGDLIYVSRRNLDKRDLATDGFVAVQADDAPVIHYYGDAKPSVDAPIQRQLFRSMPAINFMLHAHVYVRDAPFTHTLVPCGALEEVVEVLQAAGVNPSYPVFVNLTGHGCLALATEASQLAGIQFVARDIPECHSLFEVDHIQ